MRQMIIVMLIVVAGCQSVPADRLYQQLGGEPGIASLVDTFMQGLGNDARIRQHFSRTNPDRFREKLIEQFCQLAGGPCSYTGDSMAEAHRGLDIGEADFNALVEVLINAMNTEEIPVSAQNRLLKPLAAMHGDIVQH